MSTGYWLIEIIYEGGASQKLLLFYRDKILKIGEAKQYKI